MPATPMRMVSLAPITLPEAFVPAIVNGGKAALATAVFRAVRRDMCDMAGSCRAGWEGTPRLQHSRERKSSAAGHPCKPSASATAARTAQIGTPFAVHKVGTLQVSHGL